MVDRVTGWYYADGCERLHYFEDGYCICHSLKAFAEYEISSVNNPPDHDKCLHCRRKLEATDD